MSFVCLVLFAMFLLSSSKNLFSSLASGMNETGMHYYLYWHKRQRERGREWVSESSRVKVLSSSLPVESGLIPSGFAHTHSSPFSYSLCLDSCVKRWEEEKAGEAERKVQVVVRQQEYSVGKLVLWREYSLMFFSSLLLRMMMLFRAGREQVWERGCCLLLLFVRSPCLPVQILEVFSILLHFLMLEEEGVFHRLGITNVCVEETWISFLCSSLENQSRNQSYVTHKTRRRIRQSYGVFLSVLRLFLPEAIVDPPREEVSLFMHHPCPLSTFFLSSSFLYKLLAKLELLPLIVVASQVENYSLVMREELSPADQHSNPMHSVLIHVIWCICFWWWRWERCTLFFIPD